MGKRHRKSHFSSLLSKRRKFDTQEKLNLVPFIPQNGWLDMWINNVYTVQPTFKRTFPQTGFDAEDDGVPRFGNSDKIMPVWRGPLLRLPAQVALQFFRSQKLLHYNTKRFSYFHFHPQFNGFRISQGQRCASPTKCNSIQKAAGNSGGKKQRRKK